jgi:hypothetical protein
MWFVGFGWRRAKVSVGVASGNSYKNTHNKDVYNEEDLQKK